MMSFENFYDIAKAINENTGNTCSEKEIACCAYDYTCEYEHILGLPVDRRKVNLGCLEVLMETMSDLEDDSYVIAMALEDLRKIISA